jgi:ClpX C4-type zinc finger
LAAKRKRTSISLPPPAIASGRLIHYAILDQSVGYTNGHGLQFVDGEDIGRVPCLAICVSRAPSEVLLSFCDKSWNSVAVSVHDSAANAKRRAEKIYPGSAAKWAEAKVSEAEVQRYLDKMYKDFRCSFCGKRGDLVGQMFASNGTAQICDECVAEFNAGLSNFPSQTD